MSFAATTRTMLARSAATRTFAVRGAAGMTFVRTKYTLPDLPYDYGALEPHISGEIMETHHKKHHQTYITGLNAATEQLSTLSNDPAAQIAVQTLLNFHGGGHVNHSLFWENLSPSSKDGGAPPTGELAKAIDETWGSLDNFKAKMNAALAGVQGSGWGWLVKDKDTGRVDIITKPNQDAVVGKYVPIVGIDAWEHAYYLQYKNVKADYFKAIWNVINWKVAEKRFGA